MLSLLFGLLISAHAATGDLNMHTECDGRGCLELPLEKENIKLNPEPTLVLNESTVVEASEVLGEFGEKELSIRLSDSASKAFANITEKNIGRRVAIVMDGKLLMAPNVKERITTGSLRITYGVGETKDWNQVPWLKDLMARVQSNAETERKQNLTLYVVIGLLVLGGALVFTFAGKKPAKQDA